MAKFVTEIDGVDHVIEAASLEEAQAKKQAFLDKKGARSDDFLGAALEGLTGNFLDEASGGIGALIEATIGSGSLKEGYRKGYEGSKERRESFARRNPKTSTALQLGGAIGGFALLPEVKAAEAIGVGGTVGGRLLNAAATAAEGGAIAGAGAAESPHGLDSTPGEVAQATLGGAATGAVEAAPFGPAGEIAGGAIGGLAKRALTPAKNYFFGAGTRGGAEASVGQALRRDNPNATPEELAQRMLELRDQGYAPVVGDLGGERTRGMARAAADVSPEARTSFREATVPRSRGQVGRTQAVIERESGGVGEETRFGLQDSLQRARRERGVLYDDAYEAGAAGIPWTPAMAHLARNEPIFQQAMRQGARNLDMANNAARAEGGREWQLGGRDAGPEGALPGAGGSGPRASLAYWDQVKRVLDERVNRARKAGRNTDARNSEIIRDALRDHLTATVPEYRRALGTFHTLFGAADAGEAGVIAFDKGLSGIALQRAMRDMTDEEQRIFRASWISKFSEKISGVKDAADLSRQIAQSDKARGQLRVMFGEEGARGLTSHRDIEELLMRLPNEVGGNSKTARYAVGIGGALAGAATGSGIGGFNLIDPTTWAPAMLGAAAGALTMRGGAALRAGLTEKSARWIAEALTSGDPAMLRRLAAGARTNPAVRSALSKAGKAATAAGIEAGHGNNEPLGYR